MAKPPARRNQRHLGRPAEAPSRPLRRGYHANLSGRCGMCVFAQLPGGIAVRVTISTVRRSQQAAGWPCGGLRSKRRANRPRRSCHENRNQRCRSRCGVVRLRSCRRRWHRWLAATGALAAQVEAEARTPRQQLRASPAAVSRPSTRRSTNLASASRLTDPAPWAGSICLARRDSRSSAIILSTGGNSGHGAIGPVASHSNGCAKPEYVRASRFY